MLRRRPLCQIAPNVRSVYQLVIREGCSDTEPTARVSLHNGSYVEHCDAVVFLDIAPLFSLLKLGGITYPRFILGLESTIRQT